MTQRSWEESLGGVSVLFHYLRFKFFITSWYRYNWFSKLNKTIHHSSSLGGNGLPYDELSLLKTIIPGHSQPKYILRKDYSVSVWPEVLPLITRVLLLCMNPHQQFTQSNLHSSWYKKALICSVCYVLMPGGMVLYIQTGLFSTPVFSWVWSCRGGMVEQPFDTLYSAARLLSFCTDCVQRVKWMREGGRRGELSRWQSVTWVTWKN